MKLTVTVPMPPRGLFTAPPPGGDVYEFDSPDRTATHVFDGAAVDGTLVSDGGIKASLRFLGNLLDDLEGATVIVRSPKHGGAPVRLDITRNLDTYNIAMVPLEGDGKKTVFDTEPPRTEREREPELVVRGPRAE